MNLVNPLSGGISLWTFLIPFFIWVVLHIADLGYALVRFTRYSSGKATAIIFSFFVGLPVFYGSVLHGQRPIYIRLFITLFLGLLIVAGFSISRLIDSFAARYMLRWASKRLKQGDATTRKETILRVGYSGNIHTLGWLVNMLKDESEQVREAAGQCLLNIKRGIFAGADTKPEVFESTVVHSLIAVLSDKSESIDFRKSVASVLGHIHNNADSFEALESILKDETEDEGLRTVAACALIHNGEFAIRPLLDVLGDTSDMVRQISAGGLALLVDPKFTWAVQPLVEALRDSDRKVRYGATVALGRIGDATAIHPLTYTLKDEDELVRKAAVEAIEKLRHNAKQTDQ